MSRKNNLFDKSTSCLVLKTAIHEILFFLKQVSLKNNNNKFFMPTCNFDILFYLSESIKVPYIYYLFFLNKYLILFFPSKKKKYLILLLTNAKIKDI